MSKYETSMFSVFGVTPPTNSYLRHIGGMRQSRKHEFEI